VRTENTLVHIGAGHNLADTALDGEATLAEDEAAVADPGAVLEVLEVGVAGLEGVDGGYAGESVWVLAIGRNENGENIQEAPKGIVLASGSKAKTLATSGVTLMMPV